MARKVVSTARTRPGHSPDRSPPDPSPPNRVHHGALLFFDALDFAIGFARKVAGFVALLTLGWTYFRLLFLGESTHQLYPDAADPDLRQTLWVALLLILAQGWDIPTAQITEHGNKLRERWRRNRPNQSPRQLRTPQFLRLGLQQVEPLIAWLGRFMDFCVAVANKLGAFAVLVYLLFLADQIVVEGMTVRDLYPAAEDPTVSFLADFCVYVVVLAWWATPFELIVAFWQRMRAPAQF